VPGPKAERVLSYTAPARHTARGILVPRSLNRKFTRPQARREV